MFPLFMYVSLYCTVFKICVQNKQTMNACVVWMNENDMYVVIKSLSLSLSLLGFEVRNDGRCGV